MQRALALALALAGFLAATVSIYHHSLEYTC